ncbi:MAG TPA: SDR family NAD(P)-dependent oxidoreductase [Rhizomicrobium sp.]|nr:SDR family NAD(P)-dependent oxidoreductase [Rhizomicrobium sp.]
MSGVTWIILGGSSPIARAFARIAAVKGAGIILAGRDIEDLERTAADIRISTGMNASVIAFDAFALDSHAAAAAAMTQAPGEISVFLAFGVMLEQSEMDREPGRVADCIGGTFTGAASILHHLAGHLEKRGRGTIIALGSVAGDRGRLKNYVYGAAKAGLHAYLQGLRNRLGRHGLHVMTVKPGFVDTAMTWGAPGLFLVAAPEAIARICYRAAEKKRDIIYAPGFWRLIMLIIRSIPESLFKRLSI